MSFPLDPIDAMLDRGSRHAFHAGRVPARIADEQEFADRVPLMSRGDFVTEMATPGYGGFGGAKPVRINLSPMAPTLVPAMQTAGDIANLVAACRTALGGRIAAFLARPDVEFAGIEPADLTAALEKAMADQSPHDQA